jgi:hypothetical protein
VGQVLQWQLKFDANLFRGGHVVRVLKHEWENEHAAFTLYDADSRTTAKFIIDATVPIGGQIYVFMRAESTPEEAQTVARLLDKYRVCAMDAERFSSLSNALNMYLETKPTMSKVDFDKLMQ